MFFSPYLLFALFAVVVNAASLPAIIPCMEDKIYSNDVLLTEVKSSLANGARYENSATLAQASVSAKYDLEGMGDWTLTANSPVRGTVYKIEFDLGSSRHAFRLKTPASCTNLMFRDAGRIDPRDIKHINWYYSPS